MMARQTSIDAFPLWIALEENAQSVLDMVASGSTLQKVSAQTKKPYRCLHEFFHRPENLPRYEAARKAWADSKMDEAIEIADTVPADRDEVAKAKLRVDTRTNQAKAYHRERWGERLQVEKNVTLTADPGLIGSASELLRIATEKRKPVVVDAEVVPHVLPAPESAA